MTLRLVQLYQQQPVLWDKGHVWNKKRTERMRAYRYIAEIMDVDKMGTYEVADKIRRIRNEYMQELKKIKVSMQQYLNRHPSDKLVRPYVPRQEWFPIINSMVGIESVERLYSYPLLVSAPVSISHISHEARLK